MIAVRPIDQPRSSSRLFRRRRAAGRLLALLSQAPCLAPQFQTGEQLGEGRVATEGRQLATGGSVGSGKLRPLREELGAGLLFPAQARKRIADRRGMAGNSAAIGL